VIMELDLREFLFVPFR